VLVPVDDGSTRKPADLSQFILSHETGRQQLTCIIPEAVNTV